MAWPARSQPRASRSFPARVVSCSSLPVRAAGGGRLVGGVADAIHLLAIERARAVHRGHLQRGAVLRDDPVPAVVGGLAKFQELGMLLARVHPEPEGPR